MELRDGVCTGILVACLPSRSCFSEPLNASSYGVARVLGWVVMRVGNRPVRGIKMQAGEDGALTAPLVAPIAGTDHRHLSFFRAPRRSLRRRRRHLGGSYKASATQVASDRCAARPTT